MIFNKARTHAQNGQSDGCWSLTAWAGNGRIDDGNATATGQARIANTRPLDYSSLRFLLFLLISLRGRAGRFSFFFRYAGRLYLSSQRAWHAVNRVRARRDMSFNICFVRGMALATRTENQRTGDFSFFHLFLFVMLRVIMGSIIFGANWAGFHARIFSLRREERE